MAKRKRYPLGTFLKQFSTEAHCREYIASLRWKERYVCPKCGRRHAYRLSNGWYQCAQCRHQVSVTAETLLHKTHMPLTQWFLAFYLVCQDKRGISAVQLSPRSRGRLTRQPSTCSSVFVQLWARGTKSTSSAASSNLMMLTLADRQWGINGGAARKRQRFLWHYP